MSRGRLGEPARWVAVAAALALAVPGVAAASTPRFDPGPPEYPKIAVTRDVPIVTRDGVKLYADVHRPALADGSPAPGRFPVILMQTPYSKGSVGLGGVGGTTGADPLFIQHGYVVVVVDVRGTGESEGTWDSFGPAEQRDYYETARWATRQPFSNGRLATYGASYLGIAQLLTAAQRPPGLKAIFPIIPMEDAYRDVTWHGGAIDAGFIPLWLGLVTAIKLQPPGYLPSDPVAALELMLSRVTSGLDFPLHAVADGTLGGDLAFDGPFYRVRSPGEVADRIRVPTFIVGGWFDLFQRGEPLLYRKLRLPLGKKQLLMGPWYHVTAGEGLGEGDAPPALDVLALAWFDRWVKGRHNGIERYGPATIYQLGSGRWQTYRRFPRSDVAWRSWYLEPGGSLSDAPPAREGSDSMVANQLRGLCSRSTTQWTAGLVPPGTPCETDQRLQEAGALTYTSAPVREPLHLSGPLALHLLGSTTARDTTWIATVSDVAPDGRSTQLTAGWLVQSRRALDRARSTWAPGGRLVVPFHPFTRESLEEVVPGRTDALDVEIFNTDAVLAPGHRLRVTISSGDVPHLLAPLPVAAASAGAVATVHSGPAEPSYLTAGTAPLGPEPVSRRQRR